MFHMFVFSNPGEISLCPGEFNYLFYIGERTLRVYWILANILSSSPLVKVRTVGLPWGQE